MLVFIIPIYYASAHTLYLYIMLHIPTNTPDVFTDQIILTVFLNVGHCRRGNVGKMLAYHMHYVIFAIFTSLDEAFKGTKRK